MNALQRVGTLRLSASETCMVLALLSQGALALGQGTPVTVKGAPVSARADSVRRMASEMVIVRRATPKIDSLARRLNELPLGSPEYRATDDSLKAAMMSLPRPTQFTTTSGTFTIELAPSRVSLRFSPLDVIPQGWFGFQADGINRKWDEPSGTYVQYFEYPTVVAVEANSPASRAGVRIGDSLVAYAGVDLLRIPINLTRLQTPGREVSVRVRRDGESKEVIIAVEKAPASIMAERRGAAAATAMMAPRAPLMADTVERRFVEARAGGAYAGATARSGGGGSITASAAPRAAGGGYGGGRNYATTIPAMGGLLGAAMMDVDDGFARNIVGMKGKHGVFVTGVPAGSPADRTGLKSGDVILRVEASDIMNMTHLRLRLTQAENNHVDRIRLLILRAGKTQEMIFDTNR